MLWVERLADYWPPLLHGHIYHVQAVVNLTSVECALIQFDMLCSLALPSSPRVLEMSSSLVVNGLSVDSMPPTLVCRLPSRFCGGTMSITYRLYVSI